MKLLIFFFYVVWVPVGTLRIYEDASKVKKISRQEMRMGCGSFWVEETGSKVVLLTRDENRSGDRL